jgi:hypothetical protein
MPEGTEERTLKAAEKLVADEDNVDKMAGSYQC